MFTTYIIRLLFLVLLFLSMTDGTLAQIRPNEPTKKGNINIRKTDKKNPGIREGDILDSEKSESRTISLKKKNVEFLIVDWIEPSIKRSEVSGDELDIKAKVICSRKLEKDDIILFKNEQRIGSKADEVGLFGNKEQTEFTYRNRVKLTNGENRFQLGVELNGEIEKSEPIVLLKEGNVLSEVSGRDNFSSDYTGQVVLWVEPDPLEAKGKPIVKNERDLGMNLIVRCDEDIDKANLSIVHNQVVLQPSYKSKLKKVSDGKYYFEDHIQLNEMYEINELKIRLNTSKGIVDSETLFIDFTPFRPNLFILSIGTETNLAYTEKDAKDFAELYQDQGGKLGNRLFNSVNVETLLGAEAIASEIKGNIEELLVKLEIGSISEKDVIILFISSHGFIHDNEFRIQGEDYDPARKLSTSVSYQEDIAKILEKLPCKKLVFIDACHSGTGGARAGISDINYEIEKLNKKRTGLTTIVSSKGDEESYEDVVWQNGAFTEAIVQGLKYGKSDLDGNRIVTIDELYSFVKEHVSQIVSKVKRKPQHPAIIKNDLGDLAIFVIQ